MNSTAVTFEQPSDLATALRLRSQHPEYMLIAGGTDLMVDLPRRATQPAGVISLQDVPELRGIHTQEATLRIGACTTMADLVECDDLATHSPLLVDAAREVGALQIQERATIGGNIGTSSPVGDTLPPLLALDARIELASAAGVRTVPYDTFCTGYRQTVQRADELVAAVLIDRPHTGARQFWRKVGTRQAQAISKVMLAAVVRMDPGGTLAECRIAVGAVAERPVRLRAVEQLLEGAAPTTELAAQAAQQVAAEIKPISDVRSTARYRLHVVQRLVHRVVAECAAAP